MILDHNDEDHDAALVDRQWPNGEVPYEIPAVWAASDCLHSGVDQIIGHLNKLFDGYVIRPRRSGDLDYLVLRVTAKDARYGRSQPPGRHGGPQKLHCLVRSLISDPTPIEASLVREFRWAIGITECDDRSVEGDPYVAERTAAQVPSSCTT